MGFRLKILALLPLLWADFAFAGVEQISENEFRSLASELAQKVNLFHATWEKDPDAEFYGGTTRDYLYWLKGQFRLAKNPAEAADVETKLRALPAIDVRDFIIGDSDVDIVSTTSAKIRAEDFGVRKIDSQSPDIFDSKTVLGQNEVLQGYIPAEKIRLGRAGVKTALGDGLAEIYQGKLSVHFASAEDFAKSKYAQEGINHPILLALRYLRLQAINYYRSHGAGYPDLKLLLHDGMTPESAAAVRKVIEEASVPGALNAYLAKSKFKSWINAGIQKSFRSYTNPTAALELMKEFKVNQLPVIYSGEIEPLNQYVFNKFRDPAKINEALKKFGVDEGKFFSAPESYFTDGKLYHGTKTEPAFRGILFQGVLPSEGGSAGPGLYGVAAKDIAFSEKWAGDKNRLLSFEVDPKARLVDVTQGEGQRVWNVSQVAHQNSFEKFSELFGADIIRYPYNTQAFVVENAEVLSGAQGVYRSIMSLTQMIEAAKIVTDPKVILDWFAVNQLSAGEKDLIWRASKVEGAAIARIMSTKGISVNAVVELGSSSYWLEKPEVQAVVHKWLRNELPGYINFAVQTVATHPDLFTEPETPRLLENLVTNAPIMIASDVKLQIFDIFTHRKIASSEMKNSAIELLRGYANASMLNGQLPTISLPHSALKYLAALPISQIEADKIWELAEKIPEQREGARRTISEVLLGHGYHRQEIFDQYAQRAAQPALTWNYHLKEHWEDALFLRKNFPNDEKAKDIVLGLFKESISELAGRGVQGVSFENVLPYITEDPRIKQVLLEGLAGKDRFRVDDCARGLMSMPSHDEKDMVILLNSVGNEVKELKISGRVNKMLDDLPSPLSPELQRALVENALLDPEKTAYFFSKLRLPQNEAGVRAYVEELLGQLLKGEDILGISGSQGRLRHSIAAMFDFVAAAPFERSPSFDEKVLQLVEHNYYPEFASDSIPGVIASLRSKDPSIPKRIEALLLKDNYYFSHPLTLHDMVKQIPNPSPSLRDRVRGSVELAHEWRLDREPQFKDQIAQLEQYLTEIETLPRAAASCSGNFAQLAP